MVTNLLKTSGRSLILLAAVCAMGCSVADGAETPDSVGEQRQAQVCAEPVSQEDRVEPGRWITSTVNYDATTGLANVGTTVSNSRSLVGWTGGALVVFVDENAVPVHVSDVHTRGVGACLFSCPKQSTLNWSETVPLDVRDRVAGLAILHSHTETKRALLMGLNFLAKTQPGCALAPAYWGVACTAVAAAAKAAIPQLAAMAQQNYNQLMAGIQDESASRVQMFPACPTSSGVFRSGAYSPEYEAPNAFDADANSMWISEVFVTPASIGYSWDASKTIRRYALSFANGSLTSRAPKDWTLQGSNDGSNWTIIDQRSEETNWLGRDRREYDVVSPGAYTKYQLSFTDDNDAQSGIVVISLSNIEFLE